jgi:hypothetical protein
MPARVASGTLTIDQEGNFDDPHPMHVDVRVPSLDALTLSGSGVLTVTGVDAAPSTVALPGSGVIRAGGTAERHAVTLGGSGDVQLDQLLARDARATVRGSGRIVVTVRARDRGRSRDAQRVAARDAVRRARRAYAARGHRRARRPGSAADRSRRRHEATLLRFAAPTARSDAAVRS